TVTLSGSQLCNETALSLTDQNQIEYAKGSVTIENVAGQEFYMTYLPTKDADEVSFTAVDKNGKSFVGKYNISKAVAQNKYFRKALGNGQYEGIPVDFTEVIEYKLILMEDPEGTKEHETIENPENPAAVTLPGDPNPNTDPEQEFLGWKKEGTTDEPTKDPWDLTKEGYGPTVTLVPVYKAKEYQWQFKWVDDPEVGTASYGAKLENGPTPHTLESTFPTDNPNDVNYYKKNVKEGYTFLGWEYDGKMVGKDGNVFDATEVVAYKEKAEKIDLYGVETYRVFIYAKWSKNDVTYTVKYEQDGKELDIKTETKKADKVTVNVNEGAPKDKVNVPAYNEFVGWAEKGDTSKTILTEVELTNPGKPSITVVPVFNKKTTVSTPGYGHGTFN
ncbi:MAG: hypothetical protein K2H86_06495, partial [Muribaculaceae bacterium]|nr:hypothetical protein [Muribaculaceae bacterium]